MEPHLDHPIKLKDLQYHFATSGVYVIYCAETDTYYIGQAQVVLRRLVDHFSQLEINKHHNELLQREFEKYGADAFVCDLLDEMPGATPHQLMQQETKEIQRYKLYHKRLYNIIEDTLIKVTPPRDKPTLVKNISTKKERHNNKPPLENAPFVKSLVEEENEVQASCYDCGRSGSLTDYVFECDDNLRRCLKCIEKYLDAWLIEYRPDQYRQERKATDQYRRWLIAPRHSINEQLTLAIRHFMDVHEQYPVNVFVNREFQGPNKHRGYTIQKRTLTPHGYIDIQIRQ